jgi:hypothetical protein
MFKHMDMGGVSPLELMSRLMQRYEVGMLQLMKKIVEDKLHEIGMEGKFNFGSSYTDRARETASSNPSDDMNPFVILGVDVDATEEEVRAAYRRKSWTSHPDHGGSNEEMVKINAAMEVIKKYKGWK